MGNKFVNGTFEFSTAQEPSSTTSVYDSEEQFSINLIKQKQPTLLACGGDYANLKNVGVENFLITVISFWSWRANNEALN